MSTTPKLSDEERKKKNAEKSRRYRAKNPDKARANVKASEAKKPDHYREYQRVYSETRRDPEDARWHHIKRTYGLTREAWETLFAGQNFQCSVCGSDDPRTNNWHTDHCHETNKVRGILCGPCNQMLGLARDNPAFLRAGAEYLEAHASG